MGVGLGSSIRMYFLFDRGRGRGGGTYGHVRVFEDLGKGHVGCENFEASGIIDLLGELINLIMVRDGCWGGVRLVTFVGQSVCFNWMGVIVGVWLHWRRTERELGIFLLSPKSCFVACMTSSAMIKNRIFLWRIFLSHWRFLLGDIHSWNNYEWLQSFLKQ